MNRPGFRRRFSAILNGSRGGQDEREAVQQVVERGYSVAEVADRLGVTTHSLYAWVRRYGPSNPATVSDRLYGAIRCSP